MRFLLPALLLLVISVSAQTPCSGEAAFGPAGCAGDELSPDERELIRLVNEYRQQNRLPPVPTSDALGAVANRHLLDITQNIGKLTHGWSNCPYELSNPSTWNCMMAAPVRLRTAYSGNGYENLYHNLYAAATPAAALDAWKKSQFHNALILNLETWKSTRFDAFGVAISGGWAAMWFGSPSDSGVDLDRKIKGLGVSYERVVQGLTGVLKIEKESSVGDFEKWHGTNDDRTLALEIYGSEYDVSETRIGITARLTKQSQITANSREAILTFLKNLGPDWLGREKWFDLGFAKLLRNPRLPVTANVQNRTFVMKLEPARGLTVTVSPAARAQAREL